MIHYLDNNPDLRVVLPVRDHSMKGTDSERIEWRCGMIRSGLL